MASPPNINTLSLCFLFYVPLLFMHMDGSSARDMKEQQELPKQKLEVWAQESLVSKEEDPYTSGYNAIYNSRKHIHPPQHKDSNQRETGKPYITAYGGNKRMNQPYITGYTNKKRVNQPYITAYGDSKKVDHPYITAYGGSKNVDQPYITAYRDSKKMDQPYITAYGNGKDSKVSTQDSKDSYSASYKKTEQDSYAATYSKDPKDSYSVTYKKAEQDSYAAGYGKNPKDSYAATYRKDSKDSYAATYRKESEDAHAATYKVDHTEAFKTGFFTLDDLYVGNRMTLQFLIQDFPHFLPKSEANSIPFSMSQLPSLLQLFSLSEDSPQAQAMRDTLEQCELQPLTGETKTCVSSLKSMIDFVRGIIGSESHLDILTSTLPTTSSVPLQSLTVLEISQDVYAPKWVACHPLPYPYAVFYCHFISTGSKIFKVQLGSENGEKIEALGICHLDTSEWSSDHILFKQLGIKPGEAPVCHFFPVKHLMWVALPSKAAM